MIWVGFGILTIIAMVSVGFSSRARNGLGDQEASLAIYEDQLQEVDADEGRGLIDPDEAFGARMEIKRRLLTVLRGSGETASMRSGQGKALLFSMMIAVPIFGAGVYAALGEPGIQSVSSSDQAQLRQKQQEVEALTTQLRARLDAEPDGGRSDGWMLLGQTYLRMGRFADAAEAFATVAARPDATSTNWSLYAEALVLADDGIITPPAAAAADRAYALDPSNPAAGYYKALSLEQAGQPEEAHDLLTSQINNSGGPAQWMPVFAAQANRIGEMLGREPVVLLSDARQSPGPSTAQVEAAADMTEEDRGTFIRSMVDRLAGRLEESPEDIDGWIRLGNAYGVLGQQEDARRAYVSAQSLLLSAPEDPRLLQVNTILSELP